MDYRYNSCVTSLLSVSTVEIETSWVVPTLGETGTPKGAQTITHFQQSIH